jgi:hypothetical protein
MIKHDAYHEKPPYELALEMAYAEKPFRDRANKIKLGNAVVANILIEQGVEEASEIENRYFSENNNVLVEAFEKDHEQVIREIYDGIFVNKDDLVDYLIEYRHAEDDTQVIRQCKGLATRVWSTLAGVADFESSLISFKEVIPTGKTNTGYYTKRKGLVKEEVVEYRDLDFAGLVLYAERCEDIIARDTNSKQSYSGTDKTLVDFVNYKKKYFDSVKPKD